MTGLPPDIGTDRQRLSQLLLETGAFQYSPNEPFLLASGATSPYYFDLKLLNGDPEGINAVAKAFYHLVRQMPDVRSVGGLAAGSISIAAAVSQLSWLEHGRDPSCPKISSFFVRKEPKTHGTEKRIEGVVTPPAVIIDDVITTGMSAMSAVSAVREKGFECRCLMSIVFRGTEQDRRDIEKDIPIRYIFHKDQLAGLLEMPQA